MLLLAAVLIIESINDQSHFLLEGSIWFHSGNSRAHLTPAAAILGSQDG